MNKYLKRQLKGRDDRLRYDFLPSMIEIIDRPASKLAGITMYIITTLIVTTIIWAYNAELDVAVTAVGNVDTENALVTLNVPTDGLICEVNVNDGDYVDKGDVICTLVSDINVEEYGNNRKIAEAIVLENDVFVDGLNNLSQNEIDILKKKQLLAVMQNINNIEAKIESINTQLKSGQKSVQDKKVIASQAGIYTLKDKLYAGKMVNAGDVMGYITCDDNTYKFTAYVDNKEITQLNVGNTVKLKIYAYDDTSSEYIEGELIHLSDVPVYIEGKGMAYLVDIKLNKIPDNIKTGMEGEIDIIVGTRTVMDYFLEPFRKGWNDSLKEK